MTAALAGAGSTARRSCRPTRRSRTVPAPAGTGPGPVPAVLLVSVGVPVAVSDDRATVLLDPDQPLADAVALVIDRYPVPVDPAAVLGWIAAARFPTDTPEATR